jgi:hypothetical protein
VEFSSKPFFLRESIQSAFILKRPTMLYLPVIHLYYLLSSSSFLGSTAQLRPWPPPQNPAEFLGGFSTFFFFAG